MLQAEWDEVKDPEAFRLDGKIPVARANAPMESGNAGQSPAQI